MMRHLFCIARVLSKAEVRGMALRTNCDVQDFMSLEGVFEERDDAIEQAEKGQKKIGWALCGKDISSPGQGEELMNHPKPHKSNQSTHLSPSLAAKTRPIEKITSRAAGMRAKISSLSESPTQRRAITGERQTVPMYRQEKRWGLALLMVRTIKAHIQAGAGQQQTKKVR
jgi:hypothetical protein